MNRTCAENAFCIARAPRIISVLRVCRACPIGQRIPFRVAQKKINNMRRHKQQSVTKGDAVSLYLFTLCLLGLIK